LFCDRSAEDLINLLLAECAAGSVQRWQPCAVHALRHGAAGYEINTDQGANMASKPKSKAKVIVVMPAYNAAKTVEKTYNDIPKGTVHEVILVDDVSKDETVEVARRLPIHVVVHRENKGYGGNQKTCYTEALLKGADVVVMLHPDYQYTPQRLHCI
jgi:cellulose synthase/poly-beta-1,6-N-acetylglucosamine synthase-like glycosyltransferase